MINAFGNTKLSPFLNSPSFLLSVFFFTLPKVPPQLISTYLNSERNLREKKMKTPMARPAFLKTCNCLRYRCGSRRNTKKSGEALQCPGRHVLLQIEHFLNSRSHSYYSYSINWIFLILFPLVYVDFFKLSLSPKSPI